MIDEDELNILPGPITWHEPARDVGPFQVVRDLEAAVCEYTGAPYCVATNSCTMALLLACAWHVEKAKPQAIAQGDPDHMSPYGIALAWRRAVRARDAAFKPPEIEIPKRTYVSVPQSIIHAGGLPKFRDEDWRGHYQLKPYKIYDSARWFSGSMFRFFREFDESSAFVCVSFHAQKTLGFEQGGAILHDNAEADAWLRRARFDGRTEGVAPKDDKFTQIGWHAYLNPTTAAGLLWKLSYLPKHNEPLPNDDYPELDKMEIFR